MPETIPGTDIKGLGNFTESKHTPRTDFPDRSRGFKPHRLHVERKCVFKTRIINHIHGIKTFRLMPPLDSAKQIAPSKTCYQ